MNLSTNGFKSKAHPILCQHLCHRWPHNPSLSPPQETKKCGRPHIFHAYHPRVFIGGSYILVASPCVTCQRQGSHLTTFSPPRSRQSVSRLHCVLQLHAAVIAGQRAAALHFCRWFQKTHRGPPCSRRALCLGVMGTVFLGRAAYPTSLSTPWGIDAIGHSFIMRNARKRQRQPGRAWGTFPTSRMCISLSCNSLDRLLG